MRRSGNHSANSAIMYLGSRGIEGHPSALLSLVSGNCVFGWWRSDLRLLRRRFLLRGDWGARRAFPGGEASCLLSPLTEIDVQVIPSPTVLAERMLAAAQERNECPFPVREIVCGPKDIELIILAI